MSLVCNIIVYMSFFDLSSFFKEISQMIRNFSDFHDEGVKYGRKKQEKQGNEAAFGRRRPSYNLCRPAGSGKKDRLVRTMVCTVGLSLAFRDFSPLFWFVPLGELLLYFLLISCVLYGFWHLGQWKKIVSGTLFLISLLFFIYTVNCGINYYRRPFSDYLEYRAGRYSEKELEELLGWLTQRVNAVYTETGGQECRKVQNEAVKAMEKLGEQYPQLAGYYPKPKPVLFSRLLSIQQLSGIYSPFTVEANYNAEMTPYNIPHTACHELSHLRGFMREDEANFIGFLACVGSENQEYRYSGYLMGWIYAGNALESVDHEAYAGYWDMLRPEVQEDLRENTAFWDRFDTKVSKAAETLNNTYLKANSQSDGVRSYGRAVDLMLAWYQSEEPSSGP